MVLVTPPSDPAGLEVVRNSHHLHQISIPVLALPRPVERLKTRLVCGVAGTMRSDRPLGFLSSRYRQRGLSHFNAEIAEDCLAAHVRSVVNFFCSRLSRA
jgi:hypothetical protein